LHGRTIECRQRIRLNVEYDGRTAVQIENQMPVPHSGIVEWQAGTGGATNLKRKMAGNNGCARPFAGKDVQLDHRLEEAAMNNDLIVRIDFQIQLGIFTRLFPINDVDLPVGATQFDLLPVGKVGETTDGIDRAQDR
jgi:hypothetical protein